MDFLKGFTFAPFCHKGTFENEKVRQSLRAMKERTNANFVIFAPGAGQKNAHSEDIDYKSDITIGDDELTAMIEYAHSLSLKVAIKPTVNCFDGTWRAFVNFFDRDVHCEPKWSNWFKSYTDFQLHFAKIAQKTGCEMFIAGCEMVMAERKSDMWRKLISDIKGVYSGPVSYNTDKYQEDNVDWWDCVDVISSSGYYPISDWESELDRIEAVVKKFGKPFFFAEIGCMSAKGASDVPNDWLRGGAADEEEQARWFDEMIRATGRREWVRGFGIWAWSGILYDENTAAGINRGYDVYAKASEKVIANYYKSIK